MPLIDHQTIFANADARPVYVRICTDMLARGFLEIQGNLGVYHDNLNNLSLSRLVLCGWRFLNASV